MLCSSMHVRPWQPCLGLHSRLLFYIASFCSSIIVQTNPRRCARNVYEGFCIQFQLERSAGLGPSVGWGAYIEWCLVYILQSFSALPKLSDWFWHALDVGKGDSGLRLGLIHICALGLQSGYTERRGAEYQIKLAWKAFPFNALVIWRFSFVHFVAVYNRVFSPW